MTINIELSELLERILEAYVLLDHAMSHVDELPDGCAWMLLYESRAQLGGTIARVVAGRYELASRRKVAA